MKDGANWKREEIALGGGGPHFLRYQRNKIVVRVRAEGCFLLC